MRRGVLIGTLAVACVGVGASALAASPPAYHSLIQPVPAYLRTQMVGSTWHHGCPVALSQLRVLRVTYWGFDRHVHTGGLVTNRQAAGPLRLVFRRLFELRFPIHSMSLDDVYGARRKHPRIEDQTASFECRNAAASPCPGTSPTHHWSMHAYGEAIDVNPIENPYTGCGITRTKASIPYLDRSRLRRGMVTPAVVSAFRSIGWGWGGDWTSVKDYMHFSANGH
jgi:D-alanyl-D-alanine carboxypeptidase